MPVGLNKGANIVQQPSSRRGGRPTQAAGVNHFNLQLGGRPASANRPTGYNNIRLKNQQVATNRVPSARENELTTFAPKSERAGTLPQDTREELTIQMEKAPSNWRRPREPNFNKIGHEHRAASEQARQFVVRNAEQANNSRNNGVRSRERRNLNLGTSTNTQRARSLNPLVYPDWWGDGTADQQQVATEQPKLRNQALIQNQQQTYQTH